MARVLIDGSDQIQVGSIIRGTINTATSGSALITKVIAGTSITFTQTGADAGTGDVTINGPAVGTATPLINGTAAVGTSLLYTRQDHVHPTDSTRAPLASPTFTGTLSAPFLTATGTWVPTTASSQGAYTAWNFSSGTGETDFINNKGGGPGGFNFYNTSTGAALTLLATLSATGVFSTTGGIVNTPIGASSPSTGAFTTLTASGAVSGTLATTVSATAPTPTFTGRLWWNTNDGNLYIYDGAWAAAATTPFPVASASVLGAVQAGAGLTVDSFGVLSIGGAINATPIGGTTPAAGAFTSLSASSAMMPNTVAGIAGTTLADSANAGSVGEVISSNVLLASAVTLANATAKTVTSIVLTAGDWDVWGEVWIVTGTGGATILQAGINTVANTNATDSAIGTARVLLVLAFAPSATQVLTPRPARVNLSATTTYYLIAQANFPSGTTTAHGNIIARRRR